MMTLAEFKDDYKRKLDEYKNILDVLGERSEKRLLGRTNGEQLSRAIGVTLENRSEFMRRCVNVMYEYVVPERRAIESDGLKVKEVYEPRKAHSILKRTTAELLYNFGLDEMPKHEGMCPTSVYIEYDLESAHKEEWREETA